jgi:16S rRNA C1402 N4-methylase RsmH
LETSNTKQIVKLKVMKINILILFTLLLLGSCDSKKDIAKEYTPPATKIDTAKQLRHLVLFKFKETASSANIQKVELSFRALVSKISEIKDFEWGLNNSTEELNKGFTHCFFVTFDSEEGRSVYLPHPAHKAFVDVLSPYLEDVLVVDYWAK